MSDAKIKITAQNDASRVMAQVRADLAGVEKAAQSLAPALAGLGASLSVGAAVAWIRSVVSGVDALNDLKDATGASIENLSALEDVALRTGTSFETVGSSLVKFNAALSNAKPGSDAAAAFDAIGLSVDKLKALDPAEALRQTAVALAGFADDGNKARLMQELFGKSLREVAPFLKDLSEQSKLNAKVTTEQAEAAEKFNKELFSLQKNALDLSRSLAGPLVTALNGVIEKFSTAKARGNSFFMSLNEIAAQQKAKSDAMFTGSFYTGDAGRGRINPELVKPTIQFDGATKDKPKPKGERVSEAERYLEQLQRQLEKTQDLTAIEQVLTDIEAGRIKGLTPLIQEQLEATAHLIDAAYFQVAAEKELAAAQADRIKLGRALEIEKGNAVTDGNKAYRDRIKQLTDGTESEVFKRQQEDIEFLQQALARADITLQQYTESVQKMFNLNDKNIEKSKSLADELGLSFTSAFEDAIVGGKSFSDVLKGLESDILRIVTRKMVTEPLANAIGDIFKGGSSGGGIGDFLGKGIGKLFGFDGGGYTGAGARAGGMDGKGGFMAMLHPQETVIDHTRGQRAGGNTVVLNITQSFAANTNRATTMQAAADARRQLEYAGRNL